MKSFSLVFSSWSNGILFRKSFPTSIMHNTACVFFQLLQCLGLHFQVCNLFGVSFVQGDIDRGLISFFSMWTPSFRSTICLFQCMLLASLSNITWFKLHVFMSESLILLPWSTYMFVRIPYCFYYSGSVMYLKIWNCNPSSSVLFAQYCFGSPEFLWFPYGFQGIFFFYSCEE